MYYLIFVLTIFLTVTSCSGGSSGGGAAATPTPTETEEPEEHEQKYEDATYELSGLTITEDSVETEYEPTANNLRLEIEFDSYNEETDRETYTFTYTGIASYTPNPFNGISSVDVGCSAGAEAIYAVRLDSEGEELDRWDATEYPDECNLSAFQFMGDTISFTFTDDRLIRTDTEDSGDIYEFTWEKM